MWCWNFSKNKGKYVNLKLKFVKIKTKFNFSGVLTGSCRQLSKCTTHWNNYTQLMCLFFTRPHKICVQLFFSKNKRERERMIYDCILWYLPLYIMIFTIWEREGRRQMYITILYYIIYANINFAFNSFFSKNKREREREGRQTYIIWYRIVYYIYDHKL